MSFTEEQTAFRDSIRRMVEHVAPIAAEIDETDRFPQNWSDLRRDGPDAALGARALRRPGRQPDYDLHRREEISKVSPACASIAGLNTMIIMPLLHFGTEEQRQRFLPTSPRRGLTAVACPSRRRLRRHRDEDRRRKDGTSTSSMAEAVVQLRRRGRLHRADGPHLRGPGRRRHQRVSGRAEKMPGIKFGRNERKMGLRGAPNMPMFFENMRVPAENMVGEEGKGFRASMHTLDLNRPTVGAQCVGLARARSMPRSPTPRSASVREADRGIPGRAIDARRHGDADRGRPRPGLRMHPAGDTGDCQRLNCWPAWPNASAATWR